MHAARLPPSIINSSGIESYSYSGASRYSYSYSEGAAMTKPIFDHDRHLKRIVSMLTKLIAPADTVAEQPAAYDAEVD